MTECFYLLFLNDAVHRTGLLFPHIQLKKRLFNHTVEYKTASLMHYYAIK